MLIKTKSGIEIPSSEITPEHVYLSRRKFMAGAAGVAASTFLAACSPSSSSSTPEATEQLAETAAQAATSAPAATAGAVQISANEDELGDAVNSFEDITNYNNYYEFTTDKTGVASLAKDYPTSPWKVAVDGLVKNKRIYDVDDLRSRFDQVERIYRLRCVEGWSMVIPWLGFPLSTILNEVEPLPEAKYVRFETVYDPEQMPGQKSRWFNWPYVEGLRLDEAMHDLTLMSTGLYGRDLLPQNGAPLRLVVPWKYGFKSIKSIVKIELVDKMPTSLWMTSAPNEYGFYANVNPNVDHPRWSQGTERRIGELGRRKTLMFNGYEEQVASLYSDLDLKRNY